MQSLLRPFFACAIEVDWAGLLIFFCREAGTDESGGEYQNQTKLSKHEQTIARGFVYYLVQGIYPEKTFSRQIYENKGSGLEIPT